MQTANFVQKNRYQDSVTLMQVAATLRGLEGVEDAALMMGTDPNKEMLIEAGLLSDEGKGAGPNDLIVAVKGIQSSIEQAASQIDDLLKSQDGQAESKGRGAQVIHSLAGGLAAFPESNLVLISTPGIYAAVEAQKALASGRHVMIFSDNVSKDDEVTLKKMANSKGLLLLGPDCGTAIISGVPLGFANAVRRGSVGVVGASGTGMQEITTLVDRLGGGISHAIGTGSRDLSAATGAITTLMGLQALGADPATKVIVVVSKPPDREVAGRVLEAAAKVGKPVVICFLGLSESETDPAAQNITYAGSLEEAAAQAVRILAGGISPAPEKINTGAVNAARIGLKAGQKYIKGLFSGGTFCYEAMILLEPVIGPVWSNTPLRSEQKIAIRNVHEPVTGRHLCLDLGADEFTVGRPHPMIDMTLRAERIGVEASDPETAIILLDVVLGYGSHDNPASMLAPAIRKAKKSAKSDGRELVVISSICGTDKDMQGFTAQKEMLEDEGVLITVSNASAARLAADILRA